MNDSGSDRLLAGAGIAAAILFVAGYVLIGVDSPGPDTTRADIVATYTDDATNARQAIGMLLIGLGSVCFLPFVSHLRTMLSRTGREDSVLPGVAYAGGLLLVAGIVAGAVLDSTVSAGEFFDGYRVNADIVMTTVVAGFYFNGFAGLAGGVLIAALALGARRAGLLPGWITVLGYVVAVLSVPAAAFGMWVLPESVWIALAAGVIARRSGTRAPRRVQVGGQATA